MPRPTGTLTAKQAMFISEYMVDKNATQAALRAGYSAKTAGSTGYELLQKPHIKAAIEQQRAEQAERTGIKADEILIALANIARADIRDAVQWGSNVVEMDAEGKIIPPGDEREGTGVQTSIPFVMAEGSENLPRELTAAISEVSMTERGTFRVKMHDKLAAIEKLMRHMGMFEADNKPLADAITDLIQAAQGTALTPATADVEGDDE